jgi:hypothetical protein
MFEVILLARVVSNYLLEAIEMTRSSCFILKQVTHYMDSTNYKLLDLGFQWGNSDAWNIIGKQVSFG